MVRYGSALLLAGKLDESLIAYQRVVQAYPRTELAAEAQYRIGFARETVAEDFDGARLEYSRVREVTGSGPSATLAAQRLTNLDRLAQFRTAGGDTVQKRAEAGFVLAELYLFTHDRPERALEEYRHIAETYAGTPYAAKAMNAQAWVLSRKLDRKAEAESLLWRVVHEYPATSEQLAARDYLEAAGREVPDSLIKLPEPKAPPPDSAAAAASDTAATFGPGLPPPGPNPSVPDSMRLGPRPQGGAQMPPGAAPVVVPGMALLPAGPDSAARRDSTAAPADTTRRGAPADTSGQRPKGPTRQ
jgi:tetratricopeptide (TPR) repeat protein